MINFALRTVRACWRSPERKIDGGAMGFHEEEKRAKGKMRKEATLGWR